MDSQTSQINVNLRIGEVTNEQSWIKISAKSDHSATQQVIGQIQSETGRLATNNDIWVRFNGVEEEIVKQLAEGIGIFGSPETFSKGGSTWAKLELSTIRESVPIPDLNELPFVQSAIPGSTKVNFEIVSDNNFHDSITFKQNTGVPGTFAWLKSLRVSLNACGDRDSIAGIGQELSNILGQQVMLFTEFTNKAFEKLDLNLKFGSWDELSEDIIQNITQAGNLEKFLNEELAGMIANFGVLAQNGASLFLVLNDTIHLNIEINAPGIVEYAGSLM